MTRLPSLQELRESLQSLAIACSDISSDKGGLLSYLTLTVSG